MSGVGEQVHPLVRKNERRPTKLMRVGLRYIIAHHYLIRTTEVKGVLNPQKARQRQTIALRKRYAHFATKCAPKGMTSRPTFCVVQNVGGPESRGGQGRRKTVQLIHVVEDASLLDDACHGSESGTIYHQPINYCCQNSVCYPTQSNEFRAIQLVGIFPSQTDNYPGDN